VPQTLSQFSVLLVYSAIGVYTIAFIAYAYDFASQFGSKTGEANDAHRDADAGTSGAQLTAQKSPSRSLALRSGFSLTILGLLFEGVATILRGIAAGRVPWANMWEFSLTGTTIIVGVFLLVNITFDVRYVGVFVTGLVVILLGIAAVRYYVAVVPLPPALQSFWLVIHVLVALTATAFFALGFALSVMQLVQARRGLATGSRVGSDRRKLRSLALPPSEELENGAYRVTIVGFILWTFTLIAGAIWAEKAWGRYWGWDTKEVWTFIIWVIYAGYIHARATRGWRGSRSAWLAIIGFSAVLFNFGVVNVFFKGLHSYSGL
jgi:cytochrome c-type biogenesis protein CcsB